MFSAVISCAASIAEIMDFFGKCRLGELFLGLVFGEEQARA